MDFVKGLLYYTCNTHDPNIETAIRRQLLRVRGERELGCVSLKPTDFGDWNITLDLPRCAESMHRQILAGLQRIEAETVFLIESDVLYHASHFDFASPRGDTFYYNTNVWRVRYADGHAVRTDELQQVSGICASRELLLDFYTRRVAQIEAQGFNRHYEPGLKQTVGGQRVENRQAAFPNLCLRHGANLTKSKWSPDEFRDPRYARGWTETDGEIAGWGKVGEIVQQIKEGTYGLS